MNSEILTLAAVSRFNDEEFPVNAQKFVPISRAGRDFVERIADISVTQSIAVNRPAAGKLRYEFFVVDHFAPEAAVLIENIMAALDSVGVTPLSNQTVRRSRPQNGT